MKKEYDFSKGQRGKFYNPDAEFYIPVYLDREIWEVLERIPNSRLRKLFPVQAIGLNGIGEIFYFTCPCSAFSCATIE